MQRKELTLKLHIYIYIIRERFCTTCLLHKQLSPNTDNRPRERQVQGRKEYGLNNRLGLYTAINSVRGRCYYNNKESDDYPCLIKAEDISKNDKKLVDPNDDSAKITDWKRGLEGLQR